MNKSERKPRTYKATDIVYQDAMKRAKQEDRHLSKLIETFVLLYASGAKSFKFFKEKK